MTRTRGIYETGTLLKRPPSNSPKICSRPWLRKGLLALLGAAIIGGLLFFRPHMNLQELERFIEQWGMWGPLGFVLCYAAATVLMLPGGALTYIGGFFFGPIQGTLFSLCGATFGATLAFLLARHLVGDAISQKLNERLPAIQKGIQQDGWKYVMATRLIPIFPFNLLNYAFGLTELRTLPYALATFVFMIPGAFAYTYAGYATRAVVGEAAHAASIKQALEAASIVIGLFFLLWLMRRVWAQRSRLWESEKVGKKQNRK
jgi:uncharacterized membrane protein YdjX (TVP38/TMEM64 family)